MSESDESPQLPDVTDPVFGAGGMKARAERLVDGYREHEYWSDPLAVRQVLRECAATVERIGALGARITDGDSELAEASRWLADLLAWHGRRRAELEQDRPPRPAPQLYRHL